jgi:hypothetical protein
LSIRLQHPGPPQYRAGAAWRPADTLDRLGDPDAERVRQLVTLSGDDG